MKMAFTATLAAPALGIARAAAPEAAANPTADWLARWENNILQSARTRYCDRELGEEIGWLVSPFLDGFYWGYQATKEVRWVERLADWAEAWIQRGVREPDGFTGWPKGGSGGAVAQELHTDSLLGEAMGLRPVVAMAATILKVPALKERFGAQAGAWLKLAGQIHEKWMARGCWREVREGGLWVVPVFGIDAAGHWTEGYARRRTDGFSNPANKQNHIARWLLTLHEATGNPIYLEQARQWWRLMKSRMRLREDGRYFVWNYWDPAGPWDYQSGGAPKHWVGVHPNGGYYAIDVEAIVAACERGLVFDQEDLRRLVATNRDFMWNQKLPGAQFRRLDGGDPDPRWKNSPGLLWTSLVPHDATLHKIFLANHHPENWGGLAVTPWYLAHRAAGLAEPK